MHRGRAGAAAPAGTVRRRWLGALLLLGGVILVLVSPLIGPVPIPLESSLGILAHGPGPVSSPAACAGIQVSANLAG